MMQRFITVFLAGIMAACTSSPGIRTPVADSMNIEQARQSKQTGTKVRWGGIIVSVKNKSNHSIIEVVERPLTRYGVPKVTNKTGGRFLAQSQGFIEPENVKNGRYITVNGIINEYQSGQIGDFDYEYPLVSINEYKVWPVNQYRPYRHYHSFYYYDPFWRHYPYYFRHHHYNHHYW